MPLPQPISQPGISGKFVGVVAALLEHILALFSLAALEVRQRLQQTIVCGILFLTAAFFIIVGYFGLLATIGTFFVFHVHSSWLLVFGVITLFHFLVAGLLFLILYRKQATPFLPLTRRELHIDLQSLSKISQESSQNSF